ncbi:unnamed protein product [Dibothriocephalus latus]|uniref:Uncharacterized protein n=1 Tax=Dibothriocephalus latus TaxID=60516 RepID=A0A3P7RIX9_DIBLA|nr:unnamed protein product [Dibothriocephalus latus]
MADISREIEKELRQCDSKHVKVEEEEEEEEKKNTPGPLYDQITHVFDYLEYPIRSQQMHVYKATLGTTVG